VRDYTSAGVIQYSKFCLIINTYDSDYCIDKCLHHNLIIVSIILVSTGGIGPNTHQGNKRKQHANIKPYLSENGSTATLAGNIKP